MAPNDSGLRATGTWARARIAFAVAANVALAVGVVGALTWLATRPGLRARLDLTASRRFTLQDVTRDVLEHVPAGEPVEIDVFFQLLTPPLTRAGLEAQQATLEVLRLVEQFRPELFTLEVHAATPDPESRVPIEARKRELGIEAQNVVVVSRGPRREVLDLLGDIAEIDLGNPAGREGVYRPPSIEQLRPEEAIARAILKVAEDSELRLCFSWGQGERDLYGEGAVDLGRLHSALLADGFEVGRWVPDEDGAIPADCAVLAIIAPEEPFDEAARQRILDYLDGGGRLVVAPHYFVGDEPGSVRDLLAHAGIRLGQGYVAGWFRDEQQQLVTGRMECAALVLRASEMAPEHPITRPLRIGDRSVRVSLCQPLERGQRPPGAALLDILASPAETWADRTRNRQNDWQPQEDEAQGPFSLAMTAVYEPERIGPSPEPGAARGDARVFAIGTADVFANSIFSYNGDFALNVFNWAASREYRVNVSMRDPDLRRLDLRTGKALGTMNLVATWILPGACVLLGFLTFLRRRR